MKKYFTLLAAAVAMLFTAQAEPLTFLMGNDEGAQIINHGKFNPYGRFIGNTDGNSVILVGEADFGDGTVYKAASIRFGNGWGGNVGTAILSAGDDLASAVPFATFALIENSYTSLQSLGANFAAAPTGVKKVYLTFQDRAGNIMDVRLYDETLSADKFESGSLLKEPCDWTGYSDMATVLDINDAVLTVPYNADTKIDNGSWGWTGEGNVVNYGTLDFGNGDYKQVVLELASHYQENQADHSVDVYIDDYNNEANKIANVWCGIDPARKLYLARNIEAISGEHTVYLKWHGGSINIANVHFVKDYLYSIGNRIDLTAFNIEKNHEVASENAVRYSFRGNVADGEDVVSVNQNSGRTTIMYLHAGDQPRWETDNIGYTADGSVLRITGVDFENGRFNEILVNYATGNNDPSYPESNFFKFYVDLEEDGGAPDWSKIRVELADVEPIASVWMQSSGGWGDEVTNKGALSELTGEHTLYVVYGGDGANIKDIYLDGDARPVKSVITYESEVENATVAVSVGGETIESGAEVEEGATVTVVVTPAEGYKVADVTVNTAGAAAGAGAPRRAAVDVDEAGENTYTFVMPAEAVTINVAVEEVVVTAVSDINVAEGAAVKYVNVMGQVSDRPFQGVNIVIEGNKTYKIVK